MQTTWTLNKTHAEGAELSVAENLIAKNSLVLRKVCTVHMKTI
jgi:hypothetical protein